MAVRVQLLSTPLCVGDATTVVTACAVPSSADCLHRCLVSPVVLLCAGQPDPPGACMCGLVKQEWQAFKPDEALVKALAAAVGPSLDFVSVITAHSQADGSVDSVGAGAAAGDSASDVAGDVDGKRKNAPSVTGASLAGVELKAFPGGDKDDKDDSKDSGGGTTDPQLHALVTYMRQCDDLLAVATNGIQLLDELECQHRVVSSKTKELHASCKKLTEEQVRVTAGQCVS